MRALLLLLATAAGAEAPARPYWLKLYAPAPYREALTAELLVKSLDAVPKAVAAIEKSGGALTQELATFARSDKFGEQQLSFAADGSKRKALLKALRKLGSMPDPRSSSLGPPAPRAEIREKLARLLKEKGERKGKAPATAADEAVDELINHLSSAEAQAQAAESRVLWNLTIRVGR